MRHYKSVHLEIVESLAMDALLLAYRRLVARRRKPQKIRSGNATTFKAAADKVDVGWQFKPPAAPWHGVMT